MREMDERGDLESTSTDAEDEEEAKGECEMQATPPRRRRGGKAQTDERERRSEKGAPKKGRHFEKGFINLAETWLADTDRNRNLNLIISSFNSNLHQNNKSTYHPIY